MKQITVNRDNKPIYNINFVDSYSYITDMLNNSKFVNRNICIVSDSNVAGIYLLKLVEAAERANIKNTSFLLTFFIDTFHQLLLRYRRQQLLRQVEFAGCSLCIQIVIPVLHLH